MREGNGHSIGEEMSARYRIMEVYMEDVFPIGRQVGGAIVDRLLSRYCRIYLKEDMLCRGL